MVIILKSLVPEGNKKEWGASEIARRSGLPVGTVHRILLDLKKYGMVIQNDNNKKFRLGLLIMELGLIARSNMSIMESARPILKQLMEKSMETTHLTVRDGYEGVLIDKIDTVHELRFVQAIGKRTLLTQGALKKAMLAYLPEDEISCVLDQIEQILGAMGKSINRKSIIAELSQIRENGYAFSFGEVNPGTVAIGSPVFDYKGRVVASIGIMGPENRFSQDEIPFKIKIVKKAAVDLVRSIGGYIRSQES
ncbi:transcriptional regulator, IclR family [Desulfotomaculum arcticum]|uniref:Transcriptional regulator, IclR family n=1 Tax=Desulfotruncus arcticus DSM 17038 TaxID=1121424 RepID=A0A1I2YNE9_9FIRM|nr:transcriptional regulator, IclR family [Desulfotomaculum arcticum] [Desulfotruncus arcticus DSM 17038]